MKLAFVNLCGFRGFRSPVHFEFSDSFTIIDGRNGVGKSTIFDAVEFALTGTISKYLHAKSGGESVDDYIWWVGDGEVLSEQFVEVGFRDGDGVISLRRTPFDPIDTDISELSTKLMDADIAPSQALTQLCGSTIIRDEHISRFSLDMKETERFALLRNAIGAADAEHWIGRAQALHSKSGARVKSAITENERANQNLAAALRQVDQARAARPTASLISEAATRLQNRLNTTVTPDQLPDLARRRIAEIAGQIVLLDLLIHEFRQVEQSRTRLPELDLLVDKTDQELRNAGTALEECIAAIEDSSPSTTLDQQARQMDELVNLGRELNLRDGHCPLCETAISQDSFDRGLETALNLAKRISAQAVEQAEKERARDAARAALTAAEEAQKSATLERNAVFDKVTEFGHRLAAASLVNATYEDMQQKRSTLESDRQSITADLQLIDMVSLDHAISQATSNEAVAREEVSQTESRLGRARVAETRSRAIYDAARRAAAETLDQRLDRVLPLMSELYKRLRPHPIWRDIEYSVRGDVQRFLKLKVGDDVNPQFVFSSGQRRATGLAFLLSVNLSITWSRWRSILLDDPVQHVDDFRTVHLAEVLSHLCDSGRQIICVVEDAALAELLCRRLPDSDRVPGKRLTLGTDRDGTLKVQHEEQVPPLSRRALVLADESKSA